MHVTVIGSGYVGTTIAACFAEIDHQVTAIDIDQEIVETLNEGNAPISEPGLDDLIAKHAGDRLTASTGYDAVPESDVTFLAIGTPSNDNGSIDLGGLKAAAKATGEALADKSDRHLVVIKSTVTPPSIRDVLEPAIRAGSNDNDAVEIATNPEFLKEGTAVSDFQHPDKLVVGTDSEWATDQLIAVYDPLLEAEMPIIDTDPETAAMIKYANNAFLASKISLVNDLGNICKEFDLDGYEVADAIGLDDRISARFLRSGLGWGGSCFPKDTAAIRAAARKQGYEPSMLDAATEINDRQPARLLSLLDSHVDVADKRVAVLGLSFKPGTDDIRNSRAIPVIEGLQARDAAVAAYDPVATDHMRERFPEIGYTDSPRAALKDASAALVVTDWPEITELDGEFDAMSTPVVVDGRHAIDRREGIVYEGLTW